MTVTINLAGAGLSLSVPSDVTGGTHSVAVPFTMEGMKIIRKVLMARQREADRRIGNTSSPTQDMVEKWLSEERRQLAVKPLVIEGLDLSGIDLDL